MILVFDVGNTNIVLGVYAERVLTHHWRVSTEKSRTVDEYAVVIKNLFDFSLLTFREIGAVVISSVVPPVMPTLETLARKYKLNISVLRNTTISIKIALPNEANDSNKRVEIAKFNLQSYVSLDTSYHEIILPLNKLDNNIELKKIEGLKQKLAFFISFNGDKGELCRVKEFGFLKNNITHINLNSVNLNSKEIKNGTISALPSKSRGNESIKLTVIPDNGYELSKIKVIDDEGNIINVGRNCNAPYAPLSFNFMMPASPVKVFAEFTKKNLSDFKIKK